MVLENILILTLYNLYAYIIFQSRQRQIYCTFECVKSLRKVELDAHLAKFVVVSALLDDIQNALTLFCH